MDICFYRYSLYNRGGDRIVIEYANYLAEQGHSVTIYIKHVRTVFRINENVRLTIVSWAGLPGFLLYGVLNKLPHDRVIVDIIPLVPLLSMRNRAMYFAQADDAEYYDNRVVRTAINILYAVYFKKAKPIITVSESLATRFRDRFGFEKSITVTNGIDRKLFFHEPDQALIRMKGSRKALMFMARGDYYRKGYDIAMNVFTALGKKHSSEVELWICGDAMETGRLPFKVRQFGVVTDDRLRQVLSSADIFIYPSRHEGFGLFPLEAMACGCVVVTTTAIPYAVQTPSILSSEVEDEEAMLQNIITLVSNDRIYQEYKERVYGEVEKYDMNASKRAFESALRQLIMEKK